MKLRNPNFLTSNDNHPPPSLSLSLTHTHTTQPVIFFPTRVANNHSTYQNHSIIREWGYVALDIQQGGYQASKGFFYFLFSLSFCGGTSRQRSYYLVVWFRIIRRPEWTSLIWNFRVRSWLSLRKVLALLVHLTSVKLCCLVWIWFKSFNGFLTGGSSIISNKDLHL